MVPWYSASVQSHNNSTRWVHCGCTLQEDKKSKALPISSSHSLCPAERWHKTFHAALARTDAYAAELQQAVETGIQLILKILWQYECPNVLISTTLSTILLSFITLHITAFNFERRQCCQAERTSPSVHQVGPDSLIENSIILNSTLLKPSCCKNHHMDQAKIPAFNSAQNHTSKLAHTTE